MMAVILNSVMVDSDTLFSSLRFTQKHSHSTLTLAQTNSIWLKLIHSDSTWWWQPSWILLCWIKKLHSFILTQLDDGSHLEFCHGGFRHLVFFSQIDSKTLSLHSDSDTKKFNLINLMMAAILNSPILNSAILESAILQKILTQTNSIWLTWWWQASWILPSWILPSWIQPFCTKLWLKLIQSDSNSFILTQLDDGSHLEFCHLEFGNLGFSHLSFSSQTHSHLLRLVPTICTKKKPSLILSDSTWWWQPSRILPCWIQTVLSWIHTPTYLLSDSLKNALTPFWLWLKLIQSDSNSFILTQLDDGSHLKFCHLEFGHLGFSHLSFSSQSHSHLPGLVPTICTKKTSLPLPSPPFAQKKLHSFILTQLDDGSHLEFCHVGLKNFIHSFWLNLMMAAILNSTMLNSDTLFSSLKFTQKHSHSTLTLD